MYVVNGLEYLGRNVIIKGREGVEVKRFVTIKKVDSMPSKKHVLKWVKKYKSEKNADIRKVWVMEMVGNKWKKVMGTFTI